MELRSRLRSSCLSTDNRNFNDLPRLQHKEPVVYSLLGSSPILIFIKSFLKKPHSKSQRRKFAIKVSVEDPRLEIQSSLRRSLTANEVLVFSASVYLTADASMGPIKEPRTLPIHIRSWESSSSAFQKDGVPLFLSFFFLRKAHASLTF